MNGRPNGLSNELNNQFKGFISCNMRLDFVSLPKIVFAYNSLFCSNSRLDSQMETTLLMQKLPPKCHLPSRILWIQPQNTMKEDYNENYFVYDCKTYTKTKLLFILCLSLFAITIWRDFAFRYT